MDELYERMITALNHEIDRLSEPEQAAIFGWLVCLLGEPAPAGREQFNARMQDWLTGHDRLEAILWYRFILQRCQAGRQMLSVPGQD